MKEENQQTTAEEQPWRRFKDQFPAKLYTALELAESHELGCSTNIFAWLPHGRAFKIIDERVFMNTVVPIFFKQTKIRSFYRQLNMWGFKRLPVGIDNGAWYHPYFLRGAPDEMQKMVRLKIKGGMKSSGYQSSNHNSLEESSSNNNNNTTVDLGLLPDFYSMPPPEVQSEAQAEVQVVSLPPDVCTNNVSLNNSEHSYESQSTEQSAIASASGQRQYFPEIAESNARGAIAGIVPVLPFVDSPTPLGRWVDNGNGIGVTSHLTTPFLAAPSSNNNNEINVNALQHNQHQHQVQSSQSQIDVLHQLSTALRQQVNQQAFISTVFPNGMQEQEATATKTVVSSDIYENHQEQEELLEPLPFQFQSNDDLREDDILSDNSFHCIDELIDVLKV